MQTTLTLQRLAPWALHFYCGRSLRRLAVTVWLLAMGTLLGAWGLHQFALEPQRAAMQAASTVTPQPAAVNNPATNAWPARGLIDEVLLEMNRARERAGLLWGAGGLVVRPLERDATAALGRHDIAMTLNGSYASVRRMVAELLNRYPSLALVSLEARREDASHTRVEAQLRWVFVYDTGNDTAVRNLPVPVRAPIANAPADPFAAPPAAATAPRPVAPRVLPVVAPVVTPAPSAPPLPFKFLGRVSGEANSSRPQTVFLALGKQVLRVQVGDTLMGQYRVDALEEGAVRFTYLPLSEQQSLLLR